jgi:hypothetical protein
MADQTTTPTPAPASDFQAPPPATVTDAQQQANQFLGDFRILIKKLPKFESPHPIAAQQIKGHRNVPPAFSKAAADAVANAPELQVTNVMDLALVQSDIQQIEAYPTMFDEVQAWIDAGRFSVAVKQAKANIASQRTLKVAEALASDPDFAHLGSRVAVIKESKRKKRSSTSQAGQQPSQNGGPIAPITTPTPK